MTSSASNPQQLRHSANIRRMSGQMPKQGQHSALGRPASGTKGNRINDHRIINDDDGHVKVAVRCRPMSDKELAANYDSIVEIESDKRIVIHDVSDSPSVQLGTRSVERKNISHVYDFDMVFDEQATQENVYDTACRPIVASALEGYNGTIFAYGQTGTGKTFTMEGGGRRIGNQPKTGRPSDPVPSKQKGKDNLSRQDNASKQDAAEDDSVAGIVPRSFKQIFQHVGQNTGVQFLIRASYVEIYQEEIRDLLRRDKSKQKLELHERPDIGVYVKDLTSFVCKSIGEIERVMRVGNRNRIVAATDMNEHSSRSHAIFMITIEQQKFARQQQTQTDNQDQHKFSVQSKSLRGPLAKVVNSANHSARAPTIRESGTEQQQVIRVGKLNLVDLAGSERQRKTNSFGQRQQESIKINLSLSALGNVINSLMKLQLPQQQSNKSATTTTHTPYRDSKLTRLLQDSLGGNAKTLMIANIGPASYNYDETINTLNYASRARCIKNKPRVNEDPKDALLRELQREIDSLRAKLATNSQNSSSQQQHPSPSQQQQEKQKQQRGSTDDEYASDVSSTLQSKQLVELELRELKQKLSSLESKLLNGTTSFDNNLLKGLTREQEDELKRQRGELANQANRERVIRDELERRVEAELAAKQSVETVQQEVETKRRLIRQILLKISSLRESIDTNQQANRIELDELEQLHCVLQRELKLKYLIMDNFIPNCHVDQVLPRLAYDVQKNVCQIEQRPAAAALQFTGAQCSYAEDHDEQDESFSSFWRSKGKSIRPRSEFERISDTIYPNNIRYKYDNLIETKPELPKSRRSARVSISGTHHIGGEQLENNITASTTDYSLKRGATPRLQALIDQALSEREPDIVI